MNIILSPIEKIHIISGIKKKLLTNKCLYNCCIKKTSDKFKPGFESMYKTFSKSIVQ